MDDPVPSTSHSAADPMVENPIEFELISPLQQQQRPEQQPLPSSSYSNSGSAAHHVLLSHLSSNSVSLDEFNVFGDMTFSDDSGSLFQPGSEFISKDASSRDATTVDTSCRLDSRISGDMTESTEIDEEEIFQLEAEDIENDEIPVSYHNAIVLNESYQSTLQNFILTLEDELKINLSKQKELGRELEMVQYGKKTSSPNMDLGDGTRSVKKSLLVFSVPYFKDYHLFSHPPNPDTVRKRQNQELDVYLETPREWTRLDKKKLRQAVREDAIRKKMQPSLNLFEELVAKAKMPKTSYEEKTRLMNELEILKAKIDDSKHLPDSELFTNREEDFDWMRISAQAFNQVMSAKSCELMWKNCLHPSISQKQWTEAEDAMMQTFIRETGGKHWDDIAEELGTGRTGFQCCVRYQQKHNTGYDKRKWTSKEDEKLKQLVDTCKLNSYIPWLKVSYFMHRRTKDQCYQRYIYSLKENLRKGTFSESEDLMILSGVKLFGQTWSKIAEFMPSRTPAQLHSRYNTFLKANFETWTKEEDRKLLKLIQTHGDKDYVRIANELGTKTRTQCRNRFQIIFNQFSKDPDTFDLANIRKSNLQQRRQNERYNKLDQMLTEFLDKQCSAAGGNTEEEGFHRTDLKGYHITPEGVKIPLKDLYSFMDSLKEQLPAEGGNEGYLRKPFRKTSANKLGIVQPSVKIVKKTARGGTQVMSKDRLGRFTLENKVKSQSKMAKLKKALNLQFRPSWPKRKGRVKGSYNKSEMKHLDKTLVDVSSVLNCSKTLDFSKVKDEDYKALEGREIQFLEHLASKESLDPKPLQVLQTVQRVSPPNQHGMKTYSRKKKIQHPSPPTTSSPSSSSLMSPPAPLMTSENPIKFVPPCFSTLVGLRGLLLIRRKLMANVDTDLSMYNKIGTNTSRLLEEGIYDIDIMSMVERNTTTTKQRSQSESQPIGNNGESSRLTVEQADQLLYERVKALFFWPAIFTGVKPEMASNQNIFSEETDQTNEIAAVKPFDASEIISEAQNKPKAKRIKVVKRSRPRNTAKDTTNITFSGCTDGGDNNLSVGEVCNRDFIAPPPQKKRILAAATKEGLSSQSIDMHDFS